MRNVNVSPSTNIYLVNYVGYATSVGLDSISSMRSVYIAALFTRTIPRCITSEMTLNERLSKRKDNQNISIFMRHSSFEDGCSLESSNCTSER